MYVFATPMCVWRRHAARHRRCKGVKVVGRRASPRRRKNYERSARSGAAGVRSRHAPHAELAPVAMSPARRCHGPGPDTPPP